MLPRIVRVAQAVMLTCAALAAPACNAANGATPAATRYHFGDQPAASNAWSAPAFDDTSWPFAQNDRLPLPPAAYDGFGWLRVPVAVPSDATTPLGLRITYSGSRVLAYEVFVNGQLVAGRGSLPPHADPVRLSTGTVVDLPAGLIHPGSQALVAYRFWSQAGNAFYSDPGTLHFEIDPVSYLRLAQQNQDLKSLLGMGPDLVISAFISILGLGLLLFWRWSGGRELLLCSGLLLLYGVPTLYGDLNTLGAFPTPWRLDEVIYYALQTPQMAITVEFIWAIHNLRARVLKRILYASLLLFNASALYKAITTGHPSWLPVLFQVVIVLVQIFNVITFATNLWLMVTRRHNRVIAGALTIIPLASFFGALGVNTERFIGGFYVSFFNVGFVIASIGLFLMLGRRAWRGWRARDDLRSELEAAREVQQQLITPAVDLPGFKIESAYAPAKQVGGDFFRVLPEADGSLLIVVGDVSGKGLRAAMAVSAIVGALRAMPTLTPERILAGLNRGLVGQMHLGFVTCCAARIAPSGQVTLANAGHLPPYLNGAEVAVPAGLPLGIHAAAEFPEATFSLQPGDSLTFVSDGVVEARNSSGELFGFDRTAAVSTQSAEEIAFAAQKFGQDDDITVLTLARVPA